MEICVENTNYDHQNFSLNPITESNNSCKCAATTERRTRNQSRKLEQLNSNLKSTVSPISDDNDHKNNELVDQEQPESYDEKGIGGKSLNQKLSPLPINNNFHTEKFSHQSVDNISPPRTSEKLKDFLNPKDNLLFENDDLRLTCQTSVPDSQSNEGEISGKKVETKSSKKKSKKVVEEGIYDLDREIALLRKAGKKIREYFKLDLGEENGKRPRTSQKKAGSRVIEKKREKKSSNEIKQEAHNEEEDSKVNVNIDIRPKQSKKISKKRKEKIVVKIKNKQQSETNRDQEAETPLARLSKKLSNEDQMLIECQANGMPTADEEMDSGAECQKLTKKKRNSSDTQKLAKSDEDANSNSEVVPITLKAREDVEQERIGEKYQAEITPYNAMKKYRVRNFKQVWHPNTASGELIEEFNEVAETSLGLKNINQGKLIKLLINCEFNKEKFNEMIEESKGWVRNQLKLKRVWNENK